MLQCPLEKSQRIEPEGVLYSNASMDQTGRLPENAADASTKASADKKVDGTGRGTSSLYPLHLLLALLFLMCRSAQPPGIHLGILATTHGARKRPHEIS